MATLSENERREIGQHFVFGFHGYEVNEEIRTLITKYYLGSVILFKRNVQSILQVRTLVRELQLLAKEAGHERPLMIGIDQENGLVSAFSLATSDEAGTQFPGAMALAATGSPDLAEQVSHAAGRELQMAGINWGYSPVADINFDPRNPVIGVRSFGDGPSDVTRFAEAVSRGLTTANIAPSAKHFPGHGNTHVDSHLSLPTIMTSKEELDKTELVPFKALIESGIASIMTGHMALPLITGDDTPCSLSREITHNLLREELGYEGVIVTDCLEMEAVAMKYGSEGGAVMSLQAGADIVMICHRYDRHVGAFEATYSAIHDGRLSFDALRASRARIDALKDKFAGTWDSVLRPEVNLQALSSLKAANALLSMHAYAQAIAVVRDSLRSLPLSRTGPAVLFSPRMENINPAVDDPESALRDQHGRLRNTAGPSYEAFAAAIAQRTGFPVEHVVYAPGERFSVEVEENLKAAASVIFATRNATHAGLWQIDVLRKVELAVADPRVLAVVSTCAPYDVIGLASGVQVPCVATFEFTIPALAAATAVLFGDTNAVGSVPVVHRS